MRYKKMRTADRVVYLALGIIITLLPRTRSQDFPRVDRDDEHVILGAYRPELYYDLNQIPNGREVTDYLYQNETKSKFYAVYNKSTPLEIYVTPCASPVRWSVHKKRLPPSSGQDGESRPRDPFLDQAYRTQLASGPRLELLASFSGKGREVFRLQDAEPATYHVQLVATASDSYFKLYLTAEPHLPAYPALPARAEVQVVNVSRRSISLRWEGIQGGPQVKYCVAVNRVKDFPTHCSALSHLSGDKPPRLPKNTGFGFEWEKEKRRTDRRRARPIKALGKGKGFYECIRNKTSYTFSHAKPGKKYFVNVYAVALATNRSSAYKGVSVTTEERPARRRKTHLRDGEQVSVTVQKPKNRNRQEQVVLKLTQGVSRAFMEFHSCHGKVYFNISHGVKVVYRNKVYRRKVVLVKNMPRGVYVIEFFSPRRRGKVKTYFTSDPDKYKPPRLPKDKSVRAYENLTTCSNVTLAWVATRVKQRYCVYKREVTGPKDARRFRRLSCAATRGRSRGKRVLCVRHRARDRNRAVMTAVARGLKPDTQYYFDVYASRGRGMSRPYVGLLTRTKAQC